MSKPVLGRGLSALLGGSPKVGASTPGAAPVAPASANPPLPAPVYSLPTPPAAPPSGSAVLKVAIDRVFPSPLQPRKDFTATALAELAESIREQGIIQPLIVRPNGDRFELIAGERRWRAAQIAQLTEVPVVERQATDSEVLELALIENLQRENLNAIEEAKGYQELATKFQLTQEQIAQKVGRSRVAVANSVRLLNLTPVVQEMLRNGAISVGHAKVLLGLTDVGMQESGAARVVQEGLSVRQLEELVARWNGGKEPKAAGKPTTTTAPRDPHLVDLEDRLRERFATRIHVRYAKGRGTVELDFASDDELNRLVSLLGISMD